MQVRAENSMAISHSAGLWCRVREEEHWGAVRRRSGQFVPGGPGGRNLCKLCTMDNGLRGKGDIHGEMQQQQIETGEWRLTKIWNCIKTSEKAV